MPHVVNCIAFYSLDFTNICFKYHERKKPVHTFCTPIFHGILKCDKVCSCIAALHHLLVLVLGPHFYAKCGGGEVEEIPGYLTEPEPRCTPLLSNPRAAMGLKILTIEGKPCKALSCYLYLSVRCVHFSSHIVIFAQFWPQSAAHVLS